MAAGTTVRQRLARRQQAVELDGSGGTTAVAARPCSLLRRAVAACCATARPAGAPQGHKQRG